MAEFLGQDRPDTKDLDFPPDDLGYPSGFNAMGKPVPMHRRQAAYDAMKDMGVEDSAERWDTIQKVAERLERDDPHGAMELSMRSLDLTGTYRLMAHLLT